MSKMHKLLVIYFHKTSKRTKEEYIAKENTDFRVWSFHFILVKL